MKIKILNQWEMERIGLATRSYITPKGIDWMMKDSKLIILIDNHDNFQKSIRNYIQELFKDTYLR